ncbi:MAG: phosphoribosylglycinamide formyltransferase [candidate division KSB1 bacterium]|nr:phosphoribosylglycinamide formyltransferase [candidate division KSB1 bacterium]MDZ7276023.1 phosphoribosylglycinamide formyltransferase [candidate division KSB1 bacterium]MDZ7285695.1 phosphoribosylglycinamide formyltransferase [candidate division KSB1 bacterium]MDZ7298727.1 phosphoribosylglycinamide formyltransferase [candidate division KSB1 bacterium]MDZ7309548.1 phosphoribosylglycinamide formyltransferase [candidate division KSB1 bacterium]
MDLHLAIFASGRGSNFQAILAAIRSGRLAAHVALLVTDQPAANARQIAREAGIPEAVLIPASFAAPADYAETLLQVLAGHGCNFIVLAGYLRKIPAAVVRAFAGRMINIHPALLPSFGGKGMFGRRVHEAVLACGCKVSGATVHLVDEEYDSGSPVVQRCVPVHPDDTVETLAARVLAVEHEILPEALQLFAEDRVVISGSQIRILPKP